MQEFVNDARKNAADINIDKPKRRVNLYFDENDQMVERNEDEELARELERQEMKTGKADPNLNIDQLKHKLKFIQEKQQFKSKITVNLGNEEYNQGKAKITPDIFDGSSKTQNAEVFIENLQNTKSRHLLRKTKTEKMDLKSDSASFTDECNQIKATNKTKE